MVSMERNPESTEREQFDLIVIGGGVYGACLALESARRGLACLLLEKDDFGGATSWNSLRIIHGGLRYLQSADLARFRRSVQEQAWWLNHFSTLVEPMSCLMPLYNRGMRRSNVMRLALALNDRLASSTRSVSGMQTGGLKSQPQGPLLPKGRILTARETLERCDFDPRGLRAGALWFDAKMSSPQRVMMELLRWASHGGATCLNYVTCTGLVQTANRVEGVRAKCEVSGREFEFRSPRVVNCSGPWAAEVCGKFGVAIPPKAELATAFNVTLNRPPICADALALTPANKKSPTYFLVPDRNRMMLGTVHLPGIATKKTIEASVAKLLEDVNTTSKSCGFEFADVHCLHVGHLPASAANSPNPAKSYSVAHHSDYGGPSGLTTVLGVKYTTARHVAELTLRHLFRQQHGAPPAYNNLPQPSQIAQPDVGTLPQANQPEVARILHQLLNTEGVVHIDDLLLRRIDLQLSSHELKRLATQLMIDAGWEPSRRSAELKRFDSVLTNLHRHP